MGVREADADLMRGPEYAGETKKRGDDLYALVEGHRAEIVLGSHEGRDLLLEVGDAIRRYQALGVDITTHYSILAARATNDPEAAGRRQSHEQEHDFIHKIAWGVLNRARALLDALEQPAYAPPSPQPPQQSDEARQRSRSPWGGDANTDGEPHSTEAGRVSHSRQQQRHVPVSLAGR